MEGIDESTELRQHPLERLPFIKMGQSQPLFVYFRPFLLERFLSAVILYLKAKWPSFEVPRCQRSPSFWTLTNAALYL